MFKGYLNLGGVEIINTERLGSYLEHQLPGHPVRQQVLRSEGLRSALGDGVYESPLVDGADWVSVSDPATHDFFGLHPIDIEGIGDSTLEGGVVEGLGVGGYIEGIRDSTREIRVTALLIGATELGVEAGLTWLRAAIRADGCDSHGLSCGTNSLRYFLADPDVCDPKWLAGVASSPQIALGTLTPSTSPIIHRFGPDVAPSMPMTARWQVPLADGAIVRWGAMELGNQVVIDESDPTVLRRTNYFPNPSFTNGTTGWTAVEGTLARVGSGGASGGAFGRATQANQPTYRTNWIAAPSFEDQTVVPTVWRTNDPNGVQALTSAEAVHGTKIGYVAAPTNNVDPRYLETTLLGPTTPAAGYIAFAAGNITGPLTVTVTDTQGVVVKTLTRLVIGWDRITLDTTFGAGYSLRLEAVGSSISVDAFIAENAAAPVATEGGYGKGGYGEGGYGQGGSDDSIDLVGTYFDGGFPSAGTTAYYYLGAAGASASRRRIGTLADVSVTTGVLNSPYGDITASIALRGPQPITIELVSGDDDSILSTRTVPASDSWVRQSIAAPYGRNAIVRMRSQDHFDIDEAILEAGASGMPYFDGTRTAAEGYSIYWTGAPHASESRLDYVGGLEISRRDSEWRPFITALAGSVPNVVLNYDIRSYEPVAEQVEPFERTYHRVNAMSGPTVLQRYATRTGAMIKVEFLLVARHPFAYSNDRLVYSTPQLTKAYKALPYVAPTSDPTPIVDPALPVLPAPPRPPVIPAAGIGDEPTSWVRHAIPIDGDDVALWASTVPTVSMTTTTALRKVRVRIYPNPFGYAEKVVDPLSYCSEFIVSYLPANTVLTMNGITQQAVAQVAGGTPVAADNLLYGTGGVPMSWPELSCGIPYLMTIDFPDPGVSWGTVGDSLTTPVGLDLTFNRRE